jgi:hypothetical protein
MAVTVAKKEENKINKNNVNNGKVDVQNQLIKKAVQDTHTRKYKTWKQGSTETYSQISSK